MIRLKHATRRYLPLALFSVLLGNIILYPANWKPVKLRYEPLPEPGYVQVPPKALALGDFEVLYPPGGWVAVRSQAHPTLEVEGWAAATRTDLPIRNMVLLVDGKPVEPLQGRAAEMPGVGEMFDRLDFSCSGWHLTLPLGNLGPDPHFLVLQVTLSDGRTGVIKRVQLH